MHHRTTPESDPGRPNDTTYRIRVAGELGEEWSERAHGMTISVHRSGREGSVTELIGELPDEAALMGVLDTLYTHGARLLIVERIVEKETGSPIDSVNQSKDRKS